MHMVTETYQLRDGAKLTKFYNGIDWEPLFEFVRPLLRHRRGTDAYNMSQTQWSHRGELAGESAR